jgi:hypothetical protein
LIGLRGLKRATRRGLARVPARHRSRFEDIGNGCLALALEGEIHITSEQVDLLKEQLKERAARTP